MRANGLAAFCLLAFVVPAVASAAAPRLRSFAPTAGQRGTEVAVRLIGTNLDDAEEILIDSSGIEVVSLAVPEGKDRKGKEVDVTFRIAENCPLGSHRMRLRTRTGLSDLQNFHVGALPIVAEQEPNTLRHEAQAISANVSVLGRIDREDVDYFAIEAKQGQRLTAEVFGMRFGRSTGTQFFDPYLAIHNARGETLAACDDAPLLYSDALVSILAPEDGTYYLELRDVAYNGDGNSDYVLHVGDFPRPLAVYPSGGRPGETLAVTFLGDVSGPFEREITLPSSVGPDPFGLEVRDESGVAPSLQPFRLEDLESALEQEPNNSLAQATPCPAPGAFHGVIDQPGDVDFLKFLARKDEKFTIDVHARRLRTGLDPTISVYQVDGSRRLASNDDSGGPDCNLAFTAPADGEYAIMIKDHLDRGDPTFVYRVELRAQTPALSAEPIEFARYQQQQIIIPQGAGAGIVANVRRQDFSGPVNFKSDALPPGVRIECPESWRQDGTMPVVFYAAADAPLGGAFVPVCAFLDDPKKPDADISGLLRQRVLMTRAFNNHRVWEEVMTRLPIVVTEKAPFRCWIEEPKTPLVRNGRMDLIVRCEREEGWDGEISLLALQDAPGTKTSGSIKIPAGQDSAAVPINASDKAAVRESQIAFRCTATVGNGSVELCTPFVSLRVEEEHVGLEFAQAAVPQGQEVAYPVKVRQKQPFAGEAEVKLVGLPNKATAEPLTITEKDEELLFLVKTDAATPVGMATSLMCEIRVPTEGGDIRYTLGTGKLRVDKPAPPEDDSAPKVAAQAPPKPLSRLEQLRLEQRQREGKGGQ